MAKIKIQLEETNLRELAEKGHTSFNVQNVEIFTKDIEIEVLMDRSILDLHPTDPLDQLIEDATKDLMQKLVLDKMVKKNKKEMN